MARIGTGSLIYGATSTVIAFNTYASDLESGEQKQKGYILQINTNNDKTIEASVSRIWEIINQATNLLQDIEITIDAENRSVTFEKDGAIHVFTVDMCMAF